MNAPLSGSDPARIAHGELALLALAAAVASTDFETGVHAERLERARAIAGRLPPGGVLLDPIRLFDVCDRLDRLAGALEQMHHWPSGDTDWRCAADRQLQLGRAVAKALDALTARALPVFDGQAPALWHMPITSEHGCGPDSPADPPGGISPDPNRRCPAVTSGAGGGHPGSAANITGQSGGGGAGGGRDPRKVLGLRGAV